MKFDVKAAASAGAVIWGMLAMFLTAVANLIWPGYGQAFLDMMASIYPGYEAGASFSQAIIAALYGLLDGAIVGAVFALAYNRAARPAH